MNYGNTVNSLKDNVSGIGPEDLSRHVYLIGGSGSGKSTLIRNLYKHLELANKTGVLANSAIYIDIKDEDAKLFLRQCDKDSIQNDLVTYLDINHTNFGINLLELPKYRSEDRDSVVSRMVGHIIEMFKEFYSQQQTFVQMERILRLLLFYLYSNTDTPTVLDLYDIIRKLQTNGKEELQQLLRIYKKLTGPEMEMALNSISSLSKDSWIPLLNRIEGFATDNYLKKRFGVKNSTIDFEKMLAPGNMTIFRISDTQTPKQAHSLAIMAIVIKIWFAIQDRAAKISQDKRTLTVLTLDEFQKIKDLSILTSILSQARTYNLGLILSHQNLAQVETELLETIVGNTATQIYGRVSGIDASKIARIIDPHFSKELTDQLTTQPDFTFTAKTRPPPGQEQNLPAQFRAFAPPQIILNEYETETFVQKMAQKYGVQEATQSTFSSEESKKIEWMKQLQAKFRPLSEWKIILYLQKNNGNLTDIVEGVGSTDRDRTRAIIDTLREDGVISIARSRKRGGQVEYEYALAAKAKDVYFPKSFAMIGTSSDIDLIALKAFDYYVEKGFFVSIARQNVKKDRLMCDMVSYDYENDIAISIEIESESEVNSHPEQVRLNMTKWKDLDFTQCHVWSKSKKIQEIKDNLKFDYSDKITIFLID